MEIKCSSCPVVDCILNPQRRGGCPYLMSPIDSNSDEPYSFCPKYRKNVKCKIGGDKTKSVYEDLCEAFDHRDKFNKEMKDIQKTMSQLVCNHLKER